MEGAKHKMTAIASNQMIHPQTPTTKEQKTYHKQATGEALETVEKRSAEHELKLYGGCFWYVPFLVMHGTPSPSIGIQD